MNETTIKVRRYAALACVTTLVVCSALLLWGCAVGTRSDGTAVIGFPANGGPASAEGIGQAVGGVASALGIPGGALWGGIATSIAGLLGVGYHRAATKASEYRGREAGWDERELAGTRAVGVGPSETAR